MFTNVFSHFWPWGPVLLQIEAKVGPFTIFVAFQRATLLGDVSLQIKSVRKQVLRFGVTHEW